MVSSTQQGKNRIMRTYACAHRQAMLTLFNDIPLRTPSQHYILFRIEEGSASDSLPSQKELAQEMQLTPATVTATLSYMEKLSLIRRETDRGDMRINRIRITDKGIALADELRHRMAALDELMFDGFSAEETEELGRYMHRLADNLSRVESILKEEK